MKLLYLRWVDRNIGLISCFILSIFSWLTKAGKYTRKNRLNKHPVRKILIIKFWGFGSMILAADAFRVIRNNYPQAYICALTLRQNKPVYGMLDIFDEIIDLDIGSLLRFIPGIARIIAYIRNMSPDIAIDFEFTARFSAILTYLSKAERKIGFQFKGIWRGNFFTDIVNFREDIKLRDSFLNLVRPIADREPLSSLPGLVISQSDRQWVDDLFAREGLNGRYPLIGVNINASQLCLLRRWPREYFVSLAEELVKRYAGYLIFIGGREDSAYVENTIRDIGLKGFIRNFAGKVSIPQAAYLIGKFNLFISNDSGPLHLAVYQGVPTMSFFGPETPVIYGPEGRSHCVFYRELDCSPCIRVRNYKHSYCANAHRCLREIKPKEVLDEIQRKGIFSKNSRGI